MRRYYSDPATILVNFRLPTWEHREPAAGGDHGAAEAASAPRSEPATDPTGCRFHKRDTLPADHIEKQRAQLMSREGAEAAGSSLAGTSRGSAGARYGADREDIESEEETHRDNRNLNKREGMLLKCMCSSVLLFTSITALLLFLPLLLPSPLPPPPLELLLLPLLILLLLMCLALSSPNR